ncbi:hypothetical protein OAA15_00215 [bacterium]|nr:hypothetical protein [bacterium]
MKSLKKLFEVNDKIRYTELEPETPKGGEDTGAREWGVTYDPTFKDVYNDLHATIQKIEGLYAQHTTPELREVVMVMKNSRRKLHTYLEKEQPGWRKRK